SLDCFVGDAADALSQQHLCEFAVCREVQVGEQRQVSTQELILALQRLLHLENQVGLPPDVGRTCHHTCTRPAVFAVGETCRAPGATFHAHDAADIRQPATQVGRYRNARLTILDFAGNAEVQGRADSA